MPPVSASASVFVVDDDPAVRDSLQRVLATAGWTVRSCDSAQAFLDTCDRSQTGCLLLDLRMPGMSGLDLQERLQSEGADLPIIVLTAHGDVPTAVQAIRNGAFEFLEKPVRAAILIESISKAIDWHLRRQQRKQAAADLARRVTMLSPREREVFDLLGRGRSVKEIAKELGVDPKTVHTHRARVLERLRVSSNAELVLLVTSSRRGPDDVRPATTFRP